tara:strand:+ start:368 stop:2176 length:1809 start_codon:yes stop_codon:yes gene_type:complete
MRVFLHTIFDIGTTRLLRRIRYEIRRKLDKRLPTKISLFLIGFQNTTPNWSQSFEQLKSLPKPTGIKPKKKSITFSFLNERKTLTDKPKWNDSNLSQLWKFQLHSFDWAREWLEKALVSGSWQAEANNLEFLIDDWIERNPPGHGDGWHSYTLSLRIRNWIWLFRCCEEFINPTRIKSLWQQLCWLESHPEYCHGGNHWLENLSTLAIGGLQFDSKKSLAIHNRAIKLLQQELKSQVLKDGGHEERSASYHILMLERLIEVGCSITIVNKEKPSWLSDVIENMTNWVQAIRLENGDFPSFNDSVKDSCPTIDTVRSFASAYLFGKQFPMESLRKELTNFSINNTPYKGQPKAIDIKKALITDLKETGWTILRPGGHWELVFKCGIPCPRHLPAHAHSDLLSFDLMKRGSPILAEAGTSIYGNNKIRRYERSGAAHNSLQLAIKKKNQSHEKIDWIEPVEIWDNFRAGRKARVETRDSKQFSDGMILVSGSHDGYKQYGANHKRTIKLKVNGSKYLSLIIIDEVSCKKEMIWRQWWHLGPGQPRETLEPILEQLKQKNNSRAEWIKTWYCLGFGRRISRLSLCLSGEITPGLHLFSSCLQFLP